MLGRKNQTRRLEGGTKITKKRIFLFLFLLCVLCASFVSSCLIPSFADEPSVSLDVLPQSRQTGTIITKAYGVIESGLALPVEPGETLEFSFRSPAGIAATPSSSGWTPESADGGAFSRTEKVEWSLPGGTLSRSASGDYRLRVPTKPGNAEFTYAVTTSLANDKGPLDEPRKEEFEMTLLVKAPFDRNGNGAIAGYPIGVYPNEAGRNAPYTVAEHQDLYHPPKSFILVSPESENLPVSKFFKLGDFSPVSEKGKPHCLALDRRLLDFLDAAEQALQTSLGKPKTGHALVVLFGFLSPNQLAQLRSKGAGLSEFTRYQYGDAAAVIWDANGDGIMDDLNQDGKLDEQDAKLLADQLEGVQKKLGKFGGIGTVSVPKIPDLPQTPYVEVDLRGISARW